MLKSAWRGTSIALSIFCVLAGGFIPAAGATSTHGASQASGNICPDHFIGAPGMVGADGFNGEDIIKDTWEKFHSRWNTGTAPTSHTLEYPSMRVADLASTIISRKLERNFDASNTAGTTEIGRDIAEKSRECKDTRFVLAGYSQGAWVIDNYLRSAKPNILSKIDGVVLYGDPQWDHGSKGQGLARIISKNYKTWRLSGPYPDLKDRTQSICANKDPICGGGYKKSRPGMLPLTQANDARKCAGSKECPHYLYKPSATAQGGKFLGLKAYPEPSASKAVDWENRTYSLTCDDTVNKPVKVAVHNGKGTARGSGVPDSHWDVRVQQTAQGHVSRLGNVTAVLFYCSPQPSNFFNQEMRVYRTGDGSEIGRVPSFEPPEDVYGPPEYKPESVAITNGRISADLKFYESGDPHGHPSTPRHVTWTWDGRQFVTHGSDTSPRDERVDLSRERITVNGLGPLKLGLSRTQAEEAIGASIPKVGDPACADLTVSGGPEGLLLRFLDDRLVAISVSKPVVSISTASGIRIGSTRTDVMHTYAGEISSTFAENGLEELVFTPTSPKFSGKVIVFNMRDGMVEQFVAGQRDWATFAPCPH
ncbi:cutinase family protein [Streptomyces sp. NPDC002917]|uniref:cutinase family protein n=1 Tax=Streptomyces sp. NPDC002917 TaxID=3364671 RepID=UPI0036C6D0AD